ncbi:MAG: beta strand repeat-containing protein, partial [Bacteroidota bacterium]
MNFQKFTTFKTILIALVLTINANQLFAQTTNGIFFQAVARDNFSNPAKDRKIYVQSSIIQTTPTGTKVLTEEHQANTDATGVFSISLGNGVRVGGTASGLATIDWSKGPFYLNLKVAITPIGGNSSWDYNKEWVDMGTTSFGAVPFALYSASSAKVDDKLNVSDTTTMLKVYAKAMSVKILETSLASKLTAADTLTMLAPYAKAAYTIDSSFFKIQLATKLSLSDSAKYVTQTQLAAKTFDQTPITNAIATKLNIADSTKYITPTQLASYNFSSGGGGGSTIDTSSLSRRINLKANVNDLTSLNTNVTSNTSSITANTTAIVSEAATARAAELVLTNSIASYTSSITAETTRATAAELALTNTLSANTASITANSASINLKAPITSPLFTGTVGIGTANPSSAAALDITSTTQGLLLPRLTYIQKTAIVNPIAGLILFCSDCGTSGEMQLYNGTSFVNMIGATAQFALPIISTTTGAYSITTSTAISGGVISSDGGASITDRGLVWGISAGSSTYSVTTGTGTGTFSSSITGLTSGITYYIRAYATNSIGTRYGPEITLNTAQAVATLAATTTASSIGASSATSGGNITYNGGAVVITSGVVWSTTSTPTIALTTKTTDGTINGTYTSTITGLTPGTLYYVRSYATNSVGTNYGAQTSFTTLNTATISATASATSITSSTATSGGTITSDGGAAVTARGLVYGLTTGSSTFSVTTGTGTGTYTSSLTGLLPATTYFVRSFATNSVGTVYGTETSFTSIAIAPTVSATATATSVTGSTATSGGTITSDGGSAVTARGLVWGISTGASTFSVTTGSGTGTYTNSLTDLAPATLYYIRAYATNSIGTTYGSESSFTSLAVVATISATASATSITAITATSGGTITADGGATVTARGVVWDTSIDPIVSLLTKTTNATGTGTYTSSITGLTPATVYYYRAYATNSLGTVYGPQAAFTTNAIAPSLTTTAANSITKYAASAGGTITSNGGTPITASGICWSTTATPTISDSKTTDGTTSGTYTSTLISLTAGTTYYVRAYATNAIGTSYGIAQSFKTLSPSTTLNIVGDAYGGGIIAYIYQSGDPGYSSVNTPVLISATSDQTSGGRVNWSNTGNLSKEVYLSGADYEKLGAGSSNTDAIISSYGNEGTYAAKTARDYRGGAYTDWYLPSKNELNKLYLNKLVIGSFITNNTHPVSVYWTSTEANSSVANGQNFGTGSYLPDSKAWTFQVRAVRTTTLIPVAINNPVLAATAEASGITSSSAILGGNITDEGATQVSARGLVYGTTTGSATFSVTVGSGAGTFSSMLTGLSQGTTYFVRSFATNVQGTGYGAETSFTTQTTATVSVTATPTSLTTTSAIGGGTISSTGGATITTSGLVWDVSANPTIALSTKTTDGITSGTFTSSITGLTQGTTYHVRAYATNNIGTSYGPDITFTTLNTATISATASATSITSSSATSGGTITADGGATVTSRGVVYGTSTGSSTYSVTSGTGTGTYTSSLTGLTPATTYYVRAFATNSIGTVYGTETNFTTLAVVPTLAATATVSSITKTTAISGGNITDNGGASITTSGLVWSTTSNPTIPSATKTTDGTSTGIFTSSLTGLTAATTYYVRSYATNSVGTNYGTQTSFTTLAQAPTVSATAIPTSIARTTAVVGGTVSVDGIPTASRGLVYGTSSGSSTYSVTVGSGAGTFTTTLTGLTAGTTYFVRAFASNILGTVYGPEQTFITVAAFSAPLIVTSGLLLNLDAANPDSYSGSGTTWTNLAPTGSSSVPNFTINSSATYNSGIGAINLNSGST